MNLLNLYFRYVSFLVHWVSRIYFIYFIIYITLQSSNAAYLADDRYGMINQAMIHFVDPPHAIYVITYLWILGNNKFIKTTPMLGIGFYRL